MSKTARVGLLLLALGVVAVVLTLVIRPRPTTSKPATVTPTTASAPKAARRTVPQNTPAPVRNPPPASAENASNPGVPAPAAVPAAASSASAPYQLGSADAPVSMTPMGLLENTRMAVVNYGSTYGGNPVGTNPEITSALNGDNPRHIHFLSEDKGARINGKGELVDGWGTPFFFHQISGSETEIRSAGPDRKMWTDDDVVIR